jgi:hypothetical protein
MSLVEQELPTLPVHLSSPPVFSGVRSTWYLVLCVCFVDRLFFFDIRILITSGIFRLFLQAAFYDTMYDKKNLKIPKEQSASVYWRRTDTMAKGKVQKDKQRSIKHTHKTKERVTRTPLKTGGELMWKPSC